MPDAPGQRAAFRPATHANTNVGLLIRIGVGGRALVAIGPFARPSLVAARSPIRRHVAPLILARPIGPSRTARLIGVHEERPIKPQGLPRSVEVRAAALGGGVRLGGAEPGRALALLGARRRYLLPQRRNFVAQSLDVPAEIFNHADHLLALRPEPRRLLASLKLVLEPLGLPADFRRLVVQTGRFEVLGGGAKVFEPAVQLFGRHSTRLGPLRRLTSASAEPVLPVLAKLFRASPELFGFFGPPFASRPGDLLAQLEQTIEHSFVLAAALAPFCGPAARWFRLEAFRRPASARPELVLPVLPELFGAPPQFFGLVGAPFAARLVDLLPQLDQPIQQTPVAVPVFVVLLALFKELLAPLEQVTSGLLLMFGAGVFVAQVFAAWSVALFFGTLILVAAPVTLRTFVAAIIVAALFGLSGSVVLRFLGREPKSTKAHQQGQQNRETFHGRSPLAGRR